MEIDVTSCVYYDTDEGICFNKNCLTKYCDGYECLLKKYHKAIAENKELKEMMFVAESALMKQNKAYRKCIAEILEQVQDAINEKCNRPCEECTGRVLCDNYFIVNKIKELNNV